jgi:hypothetical protein
LLSFSRSLSSLRRSFLYNLKDSFTIGSLRQCIRYPPFTIFMGPKIYYSLIMFLRRKWFGIASSRQGFRRLELNRAPGPSATHSLRSCLCFCIIRNISFNCSSPFRRFRVLKISDFWRADARMMNWKGIGWKLPCFFKVLYCYVLGWPSKIMKTSSWLAKNFWASEVWLCYMEWLNERVNYLADFSIFL